MAAQVPSKKDVALKFLEVSLISIFLDPRGENVRVPDQFKKLPQLRLDVGLNMAVPINDLAFDDTGFSCTLSFNRTPFWCSVPWTHVFAIMGDEDRAVVWPDEVPPEVQQGSRMKEVESKPSEPNQAPAAEAKPAPEPRAAAAPKTAKRKPVPAAAPEPKKRELPPYLRVIK